MHKQKSRSKRVSQFLEFLKTENGYSLSVIAQKIGISAQGLYKINSDESTPSRQTVMLLEIK
jgi:DNA-binding phage protein